MYKIAMGGLSKTAHEFFLPRICYDEVHLIPGHGDQTISFKFILFQGWFSRLFTDVRRELQRKGVRSRSCLFIVNQKQKYYNQRRKALWKKKTKLNMQMYDAESILAPLQKLNLMDDFLFDAATGDLETCRIIIELSLGIRIRNIAWKEGQKVIRNLPGEPGDPDGFLCGR